MSGTMTFTELADFAASGPDEAMAAQLSNEVGLLVRRHYRAALDLARTHGATVELYEQRGLLGSTFTARLTGTGRQLLPSFRYLVALEKATSC
jgi:hypothetical protein